MSGPGAPTYVARLMPAMPSAIAAVAVRGPVAASAVARYFCPRGPQQVADAPVDAIRVGHWGGPAGELLVVCRRGPDRYEIHCHGGTAAVDAIVGGLVDAGCQPISWQQWIDRFEPDATRRDALIALGAATTLRTATILMDQAHGALREAVTAIADDIRQHRYPAAIRSLDSLLDHAAVGRHLVTPWHVVLVGPPNVGKSRLMNRLLGFSRAIVHDEPGTTRDVVDGTTAFDGWPVQLSDTAGMRIGTQAVSPIESLGMQRTRSVSAAADLVLHLVDARHAAEEAQVAEWQPPSSRSLRVYSKCDLLIRRPPTSGRLDTSAKTGEGVAALIAAVVDALVPHPPPPGAAVPFTDEQSGVLRAARQAVRNRQPDHALAALARLLASGGLPDAPGPRRRHGRATDPAHDR